MAIDKISGISTITSPLTQLGSFKNNEVDSVSFSQYLNDSINKVSNLQHESEKIANDFAVGNTDNIHEVLIAGEKADIALQLTMQIRNKLLDAYNEIMRMQI